MKKETIISIFKSLKDSNFRIVTNIGEGRGINGVAFADYYGHSTTSNQSTRVLGFMGDCIVLEVEGDSAYWNGGTHKVYIPCENIVMIDHLADGGNTKRFPKLKAHHNLKEI
jgi:hypothetical protein